MKKKTTEVLGNKKLLSFPKHDSLKYWRPKSTVNSHMSIQYVNKSESLSWSFSDMLRDRWCLQRKYMCRQHETLDCRKFHKLLWLWTAHVTEVVKDIVTTEWYPFVTFLARGGYLFFNRYLRLGNQIFDFLMVGSAQFLPQKHFSSVPPPTINNDRSLSGKCCICFGTLTNNSFQFHLRVKADFQVLCLVSRVNEGITNSQLRN
jgi:hypothetical protein